MDKPNGRAACQKKQLLLRANNRRATSHIPELVTSFEKPGTTTRTANRYYKNPEAIKRERAANNNKNYCKNLLRKTENRWVD
ncbi:hypothetical protein [Cellvibrio sp. PSBB023]|jgi:hypothetical protein|uniref:hypothetical protein n=1 Tax=Cellvibrio sp. PSBB023 TaxID=1945512 RepID=UPI00122E6DA3|nr:hypothetical protein [Cellvibrio sp. PSBB023]